MAAISETWKTVSPEEWRALSPAPLPDPRPEIDTNFWTVDAFPDIGGNAYFYEGESRLTSVRLSAPPVDPHVFHRDRREAAEKERNADPQAAQDRPRSKRREDRARSCRRYAHFREENAEAPVTVGQDGLDTRGRPKSRHRGRYLGCPMPGPSGPNRFSCYGVEN